MKAPLVATVIFLIGIAPGLINHGRPMPHSGSNKAQPVAAFSAADDKPSGFAALLARFRRV
jgi:hypothetical protein